MTVKELHEELSSLVIGGLGDLDIIANCSFTLNGEYDKPLIYLKGVYYQSGNIELDFYDVNADGE